MLSQIKVDRAFPSHCLLVYGFFELIHCRRVFKWDILGKEILEIAFPAALAVAADPVASLIDTAFIGHIGTYACFCFLDFLKHLNLEDSIFRTVLFIFVSACSQ